MPVATEQQQLTFESIFEEDGCKVSRSPWGSDDEIGRLNLITPESRQRVLNRLDGSRVFDLSVAFSLDMPTFQLAGDMKYEIWMTHTPQGSINDGLSGFGAEVHRRSSYSGDSIAMYTHTGTHMDMLTHLGYCGRFWNGWTPESNLGSRHWLVGGPEKYPNIVARGVMLDVAALHGIDARASCGTASRRRGLHTYRPNDSLAELRAVHARLAGNRTRGRPLSVRGNGRHVHR
jgi:hypothetical protein